MFDGIKLRRDSIKYANELRNNSHLIDILKTPVNRHTGEILINRQEVKDGHLAFQIINKENVKNTY